MYQLVIANEDGRRRLPEVYATREAAEAEARRRKLEADMRVRAGGGEWFQSDYFHVVEAKALPPKPEIVEGYEVGQAVRVMVPCLGEDEDEQERTTEIGELAVIDHISYVNKAQGWQITVAFADGVYSVFDEADENLFPLQIVEA